MQNIIIISQNTTDYTAQESIILLHQKYRNTKNEVKEIHEQSHLISKS